jgi:hypothetical protein
MKFYIKEKKKSVHPGSCPTVDSTGGVRGCARVSAGGLPRQHKCRARKLRRKLREKGNLVCGVILDQFASAGEYL